MAGDISREPHYRLADLIVAQQRYDAAYDEAQASHFVDAADQAIARFEMARRRVLRRAL